MSRTKSTSPSSFVKRKISVPVRLIGPLEVLLFDPVHGKPIYGELSRLIAELLSDYLLSQGIRSIADAERLRLQMRTKP